MKEIKEIFLFLKNKVLDWIPNEILEMVTSSQFFYKNNHRINQLDIGKYKILTLIEFVDYINEPNSIDYAFYSPDNADSFLRSFVDIQDLQLKTTDVLCVITTDFFHLLLKKELLTKEILLDELNSSNSKAISLYYDGGKPNLVKGVKYSSIRDEKLLFFLSEM